MPDFNPNEMDALFREGAERHEFEYNPDAWALMEEKLNKKQSKRRILFYLVAGAFLLGAIAAYSYVHFNKKNDQDAIALELQEENIDKIQSETKRIEEKVIGNTSEKIVISNEQPEIKKEYISTDSKESSSNIGAQNSFQSENTGNLMGNEIVSIPSPTKEVNEGKTIQREPEPANRINDVNNENINTVDLEPGIKHVVIPSINKIDFQLEYDEVLRINAHDLTFTKSPIQLTLPIHTKNRFVATLFANPEWSSVRLFKESKAGWSFGAKVGYQFANKFEISAGIAYSRKIYKGGGEAFTMEGGWYDDIEPMRMDAKCDVIEIPIGLTYYVNGFRNSGFFTDLGINSYMLHSEWYGFEYNDLLVRPPKFNEVIEEAENSHLIGVGRFAIGYQKVLSNNTSFQIAPYLQFPLTGIGAGQVNVYSTGVQIAVKFNTQ